MTFPRNLLPLRRCRPLVAAMAWLLMVTLIAAPPALLAVTAGASAPTTFSLCTKDGVIQLTTDPDGRSAPLTHGGKSCPNLCPVCSSDVSAGALPTPEPNLATLAGDVTANFFVVAEAPAFAPPFLVGNPHCGPPADRMSP